MVLFLDQSWQLWPASGGKSISMTTSKYAIQIQAAMTAVEM